MKLNEMEIAAVKILAADTGRVRPASVVAAAMDVEHPLHDRFDWDDTTAAREHRLAQARDVIRHVFTVIETPRPVTVQCFVSLAGKDRRNGYHEIRAVMDSDELCDQLLRTLESEASALMRRCAGFGPVLAAATTLADAIRCERAAIRARRAA